MFGFSANYIRVVSPYNSTLANQIVDFKVDDFYGEGVMRGEVFQSQSYEFDVTDSLRKTFPKDNITV